MGYSALHARVTAHFSKVVTTNHRWEETRKKEKTLVLQHQSTMPPKRPTKTKAVAPPKPNAVPWDENHPARILLYEELLAGKIDPKMKPKEVYVKYCHTKAFNTWGMQYNDNFGTRLNGLRDIVLEIEKRRDDDAEAFKIYRQLHPRPATDRKGQPFWDGSQAQEMLNIDMNNNKHKTEKPEKLWASKALYQQWSLEVFRGHIHQENDTRKYLHTLHLKAEELAEKKKKSRAALEKSVGRYSKYHFDSSDDGDDSSDDTS